MTLSIDAIFPDTIFQALGFTLLHVCWQGAVIAGLYAAVLRLLPILRPDTRYVLGLTALLAMAGAAFVTFGHELTHRAFGEMPAGSFDTIAGAAAEPQLSAGCRCSTPCG